MAQGLLTIGTYAVYSSAYSSVVTIGTYSPYPRTQFGYITIGGYNSTNVRTSVLTIGTLGTAAAGLYPQIIFMVGSDPAGDVQLINVGKSDDSTTIFYELETQDLEFNNRAVNKAITDKLGVASRYAHDSEVQIISDDKDPKNINIDMGKRVNTATLPPTKAHYARLRWSGEVTEKSPRLEGFYLNNIKDDGINDNG